MERSKPLSPCKSAERNKDLPIEIKPLPEDTDGYYHTEDKRITIREGMSEVQTVSAAIHEVAHSLLHNKEKELQSQQGENPKPLTPKSRNTEEVEAESISFAVCNYYGIQTAENSLGYIASWSKGKELAELRASLKTINKTSSELISGIDKNFAEIVKERGIDIAAETPVPEQSPDLSKGQITEDGYNIEVDGHIGTWYVIDTEVVDSTKYFLLEHEEHGDSAACVIVDGDGKLVAELEDKAKNGKPISLMDLLAATRREEKQSVMEQLKTKPPQEKEKSKKAPSMGAEMER